MDSFLRASVVALLLLVCGPMGATGQDNRLINTRDWPYELIERLQKRGHLLALNPTDLPYSRKDVRDALRQVQTATLGTPEAQWHRQLEDAVSPREPNLDNMRAGGLVTGGARRSSSDRLNVLEPTGDGAPLLPRIQPIGYVEWGPWIGQAGATFDWFYETDPDGLDAARRLRSRSEEAYVGYNNRYVNIYLGRFDNHWSVHDRRGGFLTDNPRSFDQIQFELGNKTLSFQSILGVLDNMDPDSTFTGRSFGTQATRRYSFFHRLDWSPTPALKLSLIEGEIYHSPTASISLRNLIPLHVIFLESANKPRNADSNAMIGGSIWYQTGPLTLFAQGMLDDVLISRRKERKRSGEFYPAVYTINGSATWAGVTDRLDVGAEVDVVSANSYRTDSRADEWSYLQRGLATNFSDYVRLEGHATWYPTPSLEVEPALTLYRKGEGDFRQLRITYDSGPGGAIPNVLTGTVERTIRPSVSVRYQPLDLGLFDDERAVRVSAWVDADMGVNVITDADHAEGRSDRQFVGLFRLFGQVTF
jgi:hypothetical protein